MATVNKIGQQKWLTIVIGRDIMYTKDNFVEIILRNFPGFQISWDKHLEYWDEDTRSICIDMSHFSNYTKTLLTEGKDKNLREIFDLIENFMANGDEEIKSVTATCFLENLQNSIRDEIIIRKFVRYLGKESIEYCKAWDEFTGVKTVGLWD